MSAHLTCSATRVVLDLERAIAEADPDRGEEQAHAGEHGQADAKGEHVAAVVQDVASPGVSVQAAANATRMSVHRRRVPRAALRASEVGGAQASTRCSIGARVWAGAALCHSVMRRFSCGWRRPSLSKSVATSSMSQSIGLSCYERQRWILLEPPCLGHGMTDPLEVGRQVGRRSVVDGATLGEDENRVEDREQGERGLVDRSDNDAARLARRLLERAHDLERRRRVEPARGLVGQQDARTLNEAAAEGDATLLTAQDTSVPQKRSERRTRDAALDGRADALIGDVAETELSEHLIDELAVGRGAQVGRVEPRGEREGLAHGQNAEERVVLLDEGQAETPIKVAGAVERGDALGLDTICQRREQRGLAGAGRSHD